MKKATQEETPEEQTVLYSDDHELEKELSAGFISKKDLLGNPMTLVIKGLGSNQFGKPALLVEDEQGEEKTLAISKANKNQLIDMFGNKVGDWKGKSIEVSGKKFTADKEGLNDGVTVIIKKLDEDSSFEEEDA